MPATRYQLKIARIIAAAYPTFPARGDFRYLRDGKRVLASPESAPVCSLRQAREAFQ